MGHSSLPAGAAAREGAESQTTVDPENESLMSMLRREQQAIRIGRETYAWREKIIALLEDGIGTGQVTRVHFSSTDDEKRKHAEIIADAYLKEGNGRVNPRQRENMFNVLEEAIANAVRDGNKLDHSKFATVAYGPLMNNKKANRVFGVHIADEGAGFILENVESPDTRRAKGGEGGMGLQIINSRLGPKFLDGKARYLPMGPDTKLCREVFIEVPFPVVEG